MLGPPAENLVGGDGEKGKVLLNFPPEKGRMLPASERKKEPRPRDESYYRHLCRRRGEEEKASISFPTKCTFFWQGERKKKKIAFFVVSAF